jgi:hypothetical protein
VRRESIEAYLIRIEKPAHPRRARRLGLCVAGPVCARTTRTNRHTTTPGLCFGDAGFATSSLSPRRPASRREINTSSYSRCRNFIGILDPRACVLPEAT